MRKNPLMKTRKSDRLNVHDRAPGRVVKGCPAVSRASFPLLRRLSAAIFCAVVFCVLVVGVRESCAADEVRGLWVVRDTITTPAGARRMVEFADANDFNVLFVQVRGRGDAYYNSFFVPGPDSHPEIPDLFDPLALVIELAHERSIEVHAWINMYLTWSADTPPADPGHPLNERPEWFMVSLGGLNMAHCAIDSVRNERCEGRYMSPMLEEVRGYLSRVATELLVTYNIDGIHLDYVRYPGREYDFHPRVQYEFSHMFGVDPRDVAYGNIAVDPMLHYLGKWIEFRAEHIDRQIRSIKKRIEIVDDRVRLSAAVKAHADEAYYQFGQNWAGWLTEDIMDFVVTMSYYQDTASYHEVMEANLEKVDPRRIVGGIGVYRLNPQQTVEQMRLVDRLGLLGYCYFSYTTFDENPSLAGKLSSLQPTAADVQPPGDFRPYIRSMYE